MPSASLSFDLPEEQEEFDDALKGVYYRAALGDLYNQLRTKLKYEELSDEQHQCYDQMRTWLCHACEDYGLEVP